MGTANVSTQQYENIRTPQSWRTDEKKLVMQITDTFDDIYRRFGRLRFEDLGTTLQTRIVSNETVTLAVSEDRLWVAADLADLAAQMLAADITLAEDARWLDTTTHLIKMYDGASWVPVQADELHTSYIDIATDSITIASGGTITISSGANMDIESGGTLTVKSGGDIDINSGGAIDIESGGDISIASGGAITIATGGEFALTAGSGASAFGISNTDANSYFQWAGSETPASAPYSVKFDGTIKNVANMFYAHYMDNADATHDLVCDIYIPSDASSIDKCVMSVKFENFRAYSTGAAAGGSVEKSSESADIATNLNCSDYTGAPTAAHYHGDGTYAVSGTDVTGTSGGESSHVHVITLEHAHTIDGHSHTIKIDAHTHDIAYGIYEGTSCTAADLYVDGDLQLSGKTASELSNLNIATLFNKTDGIITRDAWHSVWIRPNALCRLVANFYIKMTVVSKVAGTL